MRADIFFRAEHKDTARVLSDANVRQGSVVVPARASLLDILRAARAAGAPKGSHRSGIFQVQTDAGVYERADGRRICKDVDAGLTAHEQAAVIFKSWEQLDSDDKVPPRRPCARFTAPKRGPRKFCGSCGLAFALHKRKAVA